MSLYEIAFAGQVVPGAPLEQVKANLARLFQADEQRIALLFSGRRVVIKSGLDAAGAEKYRMTLERAGARVEVCDLSAEVEEIELAAPPPMPMRVPCASQANKGMISRSSLDTCRPREDIGSFMPKGWCENRWLKY